MTDKKLAKKDSLELLKENEELIEMYQKDSELGSENLAGSTPLLKIHSAGKSTTNELADGEEPNNGWFYYRPTKEQFKEIECHILTISEGFYTEGLNKEKSSKKVYNQLLAGVIVNDGEFKPFLMYFTGIKLSNMWDFGKEAGEIRQSLPVKLPLYSLKVILRTAKEKTEYGYSWVVIFEIVKNENGQPVVVTDKTFASMLATGVYKAKDMINSLIKAKTKGASMNEIEEESQKIIDETENEDVDPNEIPF